MIIFRNYFLSISFSLFILVSPGWSQFDAGSDGSDGALDFSGSPAGTIIEFDPTTFNPPLDPDGDSVYHFTSINIPAEVTVKLRADKAGHLPLRWFVSGAVVINGVLDLSGEDGHSDDPNIVPRPSIPGPGGFAGGIGSRASVNPASPGFGPGRGFAGSRIEGGSAAHVVPVTNLGAGYGDSYGSRFIIPLVGGSGGGGEGGNSITRNGLGGGAGGGAILIASNLSIALNGSILANGGRGNSDPDTSNHDRSGSGSGGSIRLVSPIISGNGMLSALGGQSEGYFSQVGSAGRIRMESLENSFTGLRSGEFSPATLLTNTHLLPTQTFPFLRVASIDGQNVPTNPRASLPDVDITLDTAQDVDIVVAAQNIPLGTQVTLVVINETLGLTNYQTTGLAGSLENSTATAQVTVPAGYTRIYTRANW